MSIQDILNNMMQKSPKEIVQIIADKKVELGISPRGVGPISNMVPEEYLKALAKKPEPWTIDSGKPCTFGPYDMSNYGFKPPNGIEVVNDPKTGLGTINHNVMGVSRLGNPSVNINRKFRWLMELWSDNKLVLGPMFVKVSNRPYPYDIEETEINFLSSKSWIPGKTKWEQITLSIYDSQQKIEFPNFNRVKLGLFDGCGFRLESFDLTDCSQQHLHEEGHDNDDSFHYDLQVKYGNVAYKSDHPSFVPLTPPKQENQVTIE